MTKNELRKLIKEKRRALPAAYFAEASEKITEKLTESPEFRAAGTIFVYLSVPGEPDTAGMIAAALRAGKTVLVPKCAGSDMLAVPYRPEELSVGAFGIPEPASCEDYAGKIDLNIVPCLSASSDGRRLGHGAGYYDRFLIKRGGFSVCLCFRELMREDIPAETHDIPADKVISD